MITLTYNGKDYINWDEVSLKNSGVPDLVIEEAKLNHKFDEVKAKRKAAYVSESDPLYMEWQYDQTQSKEQAWRDKVIEIKARYPLPDVDAEAK